MIYTSMIYIFISQEDVRYEIRNFLSRYITRHTKSGIENFAKQYITNYGYLKHSS